METKDIWTLAFSAASLLIAIGALVFAGISASAARRSADTAGRSADASERSAAASEKSVMIGAVRLGAKHHSYSTVIVRNDGHAVMHNVKIMLEQQGDVTFEREYTALYPGVDEPVNTGHGINIGDRVIVTWTDPLDAGETKGYFQQRVR